MLQPWPEQVELDALIALAGIMATVLSLGFTVRFRTGGSNRGP
ncbi:MAG: hypothetical protein ACRDFR_08445 [Candidatus Limnocylindria bacterium]